jgi:dienelactone hydrolase
MRTERKPVTVKTYAGAKHGFDHDPAREVYHPAATAEARAHVREFLREHVASR